VHDVVEGAGLLSVLAANLENLFELVSIAVAPN